MGIEYVIVQSDEAVELQEAVQQFIEDGWELQGGVGIAWWDATNRGEAECGHTYAQAMVRRPRTIDEEKERLAGKVMKKLGIRSGARN